MRSTIYILSHGPMWKIQCKHCGMNALSLHKDDAQHDARRHVANLPKGTLSQIIVQRQDGKFQAEWTYGKDPFPPKG